MKQLSDSVSEEAVASSFSIFVLSGILILAIGDFSGLVPVAGSELLASGSLAHLICGVHLTCRRHLYFQNRRYFGIFGPCIS